MFCIVLCMCVSPISLLGTTQHTRAVGIFALRSLLKHHKLTRRGAYLEAEGLALHSQHKNQSLPSQGSAPRQVQQQIDERIAHLVFWSFIPRVQLERERQASKVEMEQLLGSIVNWRVKGEKSIKFEREHQM